MSDLSEISVVIPSYNPTEKLEAVVDGLLGAGFDDIIIVNDGSDAAHSAPFEALEARAECLVLSHARNMGKGASLKTAFSFFSQYRLGKAGLVTVDGDGQHLCGDVVSCARAVLRMDAGGVDGGGADALDGEGGSGAASGLDGAGGSGDAAGAAGSGAASGSGDSGAASGSGDSGAADGGDAGGSGAASGSGTVSGSSGSVGAGGSGGAAVVMGVRNFDHPDVPRRNSLGNRATASVLRLLFGIDLRDTQTGLRGIPRQLVPLMLEIAGNRFEYETNMLLELRRRDISFVEIEIATVYEEGSNERSHYRPFADSAVIFARIIKYAVSSLMSFFVDIGVFWLTMTFLGDMMGEWSIIGCTAIARAFSSFLNFNINRRLVFQRKTSYAGHFWRYYLLAAVQMLVAAGGLWLLALVLSGTRVVWVLTLMKVVVDTALFFLSYYVQSNWVFGK
ncbi:MAG: GtrA family protein [Oscillospiraceae bacterium]|nr:GtrA family protein [Oscillospiraceae bacterium]